MAFNARTTGVPKKSIKTNGNARRIHIARILEIRVVRCVAPRFVLAVGASVGALMPMRMLRPPLVFVCVGDAFLSLFRATGEFMFAGSRRLRLRRRSRPVNVGDVLARDGVGFEGRGIRNW